MLRVLRTLHECKVKGESITHPGTFHTGPGSSRGTGLAR